MATTREKVLLGVTASLVVGGYFYMQTKDAAVVRNQEKPMFKRRGSHRPADNQGRVATTPAGPTIEQAPLVVPQFVRDAVASSTSTANSPQPPLGFKRTPYAVQNPARPNTRGIVLPSR